MTIPKFPDHVLSKKVAWVMMFIAICGVGFHLWHGDFSSAAWAAIAGIWAMNFSQAMDAIYEREADIINILMSHGYQPEEEDEDE